ncbi:hypothetical protein [Bradyrhizobium sp. SZCCHNS3051]|uniref:hypothetical protein n=1 Tax=Bradyrhizobium sp. SZCCHNS3051 TaxID=3057320 RepID=UPI0029161DAA|nr:hypothetical protein [Bradyrhizobium sp. SZCCHNS3051]
MRIFAILILCLLCAEANAQTIPPEVVRLELLVEENGMRTAYMGNGSKHYLLYCNTKADAGCIIPEENKDYLLFDAKTRWKMPGAKDFLTLAFIQNWTVTYSQGENVGLVAQDNKGGLGLFIRDPSGGGYEQFTIFSDGPIVYGGGMSEADVQNAWKVFFMKMVQAASEQQGQEALSLKLKPRCLAGENYCTTVLDANFVGIGNIKEPRLVRLIVSTDAQDKSKQIGRVVCTYPSKTTVVCRDFNTGNLVSVKHAAE